MWLRMCQDGAPSAYELGVPPTGEMRTGPRGARGYRAALEPRRSVSTVLDEEVKYNNYTTYITADGTSGQSLTNAKAPVSPT